MSTDLGADLLAMRDVSVSYRTSEGMLPAVRGVRRRPRAGALPPPIRRPARARVARPRLPHVSRPRLPHLPHLPRITLPRPGRVRMPHIRLPGRAHTRYGRVYRRRRSGSYLFVRIISVPVSMNPTMIVLARMSSGP